jgi:hypothetical protein
MGLEGLVSKRRDLPVSGRPVEALGEDQEPQTPGDESGDGGICVTSFPLPQSSDGVL